MISLFVADVSCLSLETESLPLSDYRRSKLEITKIPAKLRQSIGAELLLNFAVQARCPECRPPFNIACESDGKPRFTDIPLHFNLSHSGSYAACVLSDEAVGIDVEHRPTYNTALAARFFTETEQKRINYSKDKDTEFGCVWTGKESALKFLGLGLSKALSAVEVMDDGFISVEPEGIKLCCTHKKIGELIISVCSATKKNHVEPIIVEL